MCSPSEQFFDVDQRYIDILRRGMFVYLDEDNSILSYMKVMFLLLDLNEDKDLICIGVMKIRVFYLFKNEDIFSFNEYLTFITL